ncbi:MAG: hypothetical protein AB7O88_04670 [Reyranellaceae bacterium]
MRLLPIASVLLSIATVAQAQHGHVPPSPYAGQERRAIKGLSQDDIAELRRGGGWGLAKAAELNGMPGPLHLLELKDEIALSAGQVTAIGAIVERMRADAIAEGGRLIARERTLEQAFQARSVTEESLRRMLDEIAASRSALRYIHLVAHLQVSALLKPDQIARYNALRGYTGNPCATVPPGHDPALWREHNGCG